MTMRQSKENKDPVGNNSVGVSFWWPGASPEAEYVGACSLPGHFYFGVNR